jgi:hypothetical protein
MNVAYLLDSIVQHTTALIAQVATAAGTRAPLAHVANRVFLDLVTELERQGVGRKVVADMFGMALRSYQQKVQRLTEAQSDTGKTLWVTVYEYLRDHDVVLRAELLRRFCSEDDAILKGVLHDLVESGLVFRTGTGSHVVFRVASDADLERVSRSEMSGALRAAVWFHVYRQGPISRDALVRALRQEAATLDTAIEELEGDGRITRETRNGVEYLASRQCFVPMDEVGGWGPAVADHFRMVTGAICAKLLNGQTRAVPDDELGGSSFTFNVWSGHPYESRVRGLLREQRRHFTALWDEVSRYNQAHTLEQATKVNFYFGQSVIAADDEPSNRTTAAEPNASAQNRTELTK